MDIENNEWNIMFCYTETFSGCIYGVMIIIIAKESAIQLQNLDETGCISDNAKSLDKGMQSSILCPAMGKQYWVL